MNDESKFEAREWRPDWTPKDLAEIEKIKAELRRAKPIVRRLRHQLRLSQADVARILGTTQSNVSKIEARVDPRLSVLRRLIESQGGRLEIKAVSEDGREFDLSQ